MANQIENAQDLRAVLDAIYNNRDNFDTYQNLSLYYNDITRTATIMTVDVEDEENTKNIIAVFNPENVVTQDNAFFVTLMKSATVNIATEETSVYDFALGGYVNIDTLLKNICVSLGVSLSANFSEVNPGLYSDMINIIRNEYGQSLENNAPYIMKKFVNATTEEENYKSLVPLMCIVKIAIYLNNLGIFNTSDFEMITPSPLSREWLFNAIHTTSSSMKSMYDVLITKTGIEYPSTPLELQSKTQFKENIKKWVYEDNNIDMLGNRYITPQPLVSDPNNLNAVDKIFDLYETDIDWDNDIVKMAFYRTSDNQHEIRFLVLPKDKVVNTTYNNNRTSGSDSFDIGGVGQARTTVYGIRTAKEDNTPYLYFNVVVKYNTTTQQIEVTNSKTVNAVNKDSYNTSFGSGWIIMDNMKPDGYIKPYTYSDRPYYNASYKSEFYYIDRYEGLSMSTEYDTQNIKLLNNKRLFIDYTTDEVLKKNNYELNIGEHDMVAMFRLQKDVYTNTTYRLIKIVVFRDVETFTLSGVVASSRMANPFQHSCQHGFTRYMSNKQYVSTTDTEHMMALALPVIDTDYRAVGLDIRQTTNPNASITFGSAKTIDIYTVDYTDIQNDNLVVDYQTLSDDEFIFKDLVPSDIQTTWSLVCLSNNLGEWVDYGTDIGIEGINLLEGATYPKNVFDLNSFNTIYPDWWKTQSNNPQIIDGVLSPNVTSTQWGAVAISNTTPQTQEDADSGEINFNDTDIIDDIITDIDNAVNDEDMPPSDPNEDGLEDEGESPDDTLERVKPQLLQGGFIKQYAMDGTQMHTFAEAMTNPDIIQTLQRLVSNPIDAIISLQVGYIYNNNGTTPDDPLQINGLTWASLTNVPKGTRLNNNIVEDIEFGMVEVPMKYNTYQDYTTSNLQLYLPFVGFVHLDINEFVGSYLDVKANIDTLTGTILYTVSSYKDSKRRELYQFQGNCQQQVPLNQKDNTQFLTGAMQLGATAITGGVMMGAGGAALNTANALAENVENPSLNILKPNITHGGTVGANSGILGNMLIYAFVERKQIYDPKHEILGELEGFPANSSVVLGSIKGYTVVKDVIVKTSATEEENKEIERLLKEGVIL